MECFLILAVCHRVMMIQMPAVAVPIGNTPDEPFSKECIPLDCQFVLWHGFKRASPMFNVIVQPSIADYNFFQVVS